MSAKRRRLEIVHESLLTQWPRLVRWRAQDAEGAVLRDQLRQAARLWEQHGRAEDFLWTGTAYREYQLWRERYPGGLTALEEAFAAAMTALAQRRRRRRRLAVAAVIAVLATGLAIVAVLRQQAVAQARRAEASKVLALGQVELEDSPTVALAYAIKSLELEDSRAARVFALKALAAGPPAFLRTTRVGQTGSVNGVVFSPDGAWAAALGTEKLQVVSRDDGSRRLFEQFPSGTGGVAAVFDSASDHLYAAKDGRVRVWSVPGFELLETQNLGGSRTSLLRTPAGVLASTRVRDEPREVVFSALAVGAPPHRIGRIEGITNWTFDRLGNRVAFARDKALYVRSLTEASDPPRRVGTYEGEPAMRFHPAGDRLAAYDDVSREIRIWSVRTGGRTPIRALAPIRVLAAPFERLHDLTFDRGGERLAAIGNTPRGLRVNVWDLDAPLDSTARSFAATFGRFLIGAAFSPDGRWLATANFHAVCFWPLKRGEPRVLRGHRVTVTDVRFTPDGGRLVSVDHNGEVREWELGPGGTSRTLAQVNQQSVLDVDRRGRFITVTKRGGALIVPLSGGKTRALEGFAPTTHVLGIAIDREGRRVAASSYSGPRYDKVIRVWDLETEEVWTLGPTEKAGEGIVGQNLGIGFLADGSLVSVGDGLRRWSLPSSAHEVVAPSHMQSHLTVFPDGRSVVYIMGKPRAGVTTPVQSTELAITDLATRTTRILRSHGHFMPIGVHPNGQVVVTGGLDGIVRVGAVSGEEPYLLMGHQGVIHTVDVSADGRWIASGGDDHTIRIWPMPDLSQPPLHTLPLDQLLRRLKSLTNVRVVDESSSTVAAWLRTDRGSGYEVDIESFRGWAEVRER